MTVFEIVTDVARRLEGAGIRYAIGGSLASSSWGQMRQTNDADIVVMVPSERVDLLLAAFREPYYLSRDEVAAAMDQPDLFNAVQLVHTVAAFKTDLFLLRDREYERSELDRAREVELLPGQPIRVYAPENIVLAKLRWFQLGNRTSDRQWNDIVQVLEVQQGRLDERYLDKWSEFFRVRDLLDDARSQMSG